MFPLRWPALEFAPRTAQLARRKARAPRPAAALAVHPFVSRLGPHLPPTQRTRAPSIQARPQAPSPFLAGCTRTVQRLTDRKHAAGTLSSQQQQGAAPAAAGCRSVVHCPSAARPCSATSAASFPEYRGPLRQAGEQPAGGLTWTMMWDDVVLTAWQPWEPGAAFLRLGSAQATHRDHP